MENNNLLSALKESAKKNNGLTIIKDKNEEHYISYRGLMIKSLAISNVMKSYGVMKRSEVLINCKNLEQYIYAFWACIIGGFIAIPIASTINSKNNDIDKILDNLNSPYLLYDFVEGDILPNSPKNKKINILKLEYENLEKAEHKLDMISSLPKDIVYIQFSSGSTGTPKGVVLTNSNIISNIKSIIDHYEMSSKDTILTWQPLTHCYGLIIFHLLPIVLGINQYLISTETFMKNPLLWMERVNEYRITRIGTIPFAIMHFMNLYEKSNITFNWDLSCVKSITVGGEQVNVKIINKFKDMLKVHKLSPYAVVPIYGLAESTTMVSSGSVNSKPKAYKLLNNELDIGTKVDCYVSNNNDEVTFLEMGKVISSVELRITDDTNNELPEKTLGYVVVRGESVTKGYYNNIQLTKKVFKEGLWLYTGDVGFIVDGNLVIVGREKELVVSNGKKYSCINIENILNKNISSDIVKQIVISNGMDSEGNSEVVIAFVETMFKLDNDIKIKKFISIARKIKKLIYDVNGLIIYEVIPMESIPKTYSGKVRRRKLTNMFNQGRYNYIIEQIHNNLNNKLPTQFHQSDNLTREKMLLIIVERLETMFKIKVTDYKLTFQDYGIVSINIPIFLQEIETKLNITIEVSTVFNYPSIDQFVDYIYSIKNIKYIEKERSEVGDNEKIQNDKIAIIGMSCRFPGGANDIDKFWKMMVDGVDGIVDVPETRWDLKKYYDKDENAPGKMYCKKAGFLNVPINEFDALFFNISPKEAMATDPQQRLLLELTWEAFENACLDITKYNGSDTGVYLGISSNEYLMSHLYSGDLSEVDAYSLTGIGFSVACGRISYTFGFEGPSFAVDTACSSALTALHLACKAIKNSETKMAVVAGVNLLVSPSNSVGFTKLHATSPDGHSKSFDASADGYGRGEGGGVILIKRLSDAIRDKDNILGVIDATGINQDGKSNGLTAPNGVSQANLIRSTLKEANLSGQDIDYVEMHGTGTKLGDPIEVNAVADTYCKNRDMDNPLRIGSVKSNIGHLEPASGIASIIKVLLSFKNKLIPANLNFNTPNPYINWSEIPIKVVSKPYEWEKDNDVRRAAVSGFGFGGSNAHVILEEYKQHIFNEEENETGLNYVLKISAKNEKSLSQYILKYISRIENSNEKEFTDIIYSANRGRADFEYRFVVVGKSKEEILYKLKSYYDGSEPEGVFCNMNHRNLFKKNRKLVFMFTGQGSQYINMGKTIFDLNKIFRDAMILCDKLFKPYILKSVVDLLYSDKASNEIIEKTVYAQPLIFSIEYSLYIMWSNYGVIPEIVMGHSIGEYVAAVVAGIMSLEDAVKLVSIRGRLMYSAPGSGSMGTIFADELTVSEMINEYNGYVSIAAHNSKGICVISGDSDTVDKVLQEAKGRGIRVSKLKVSHGFHSKLMEPIMDDFKAIAKEVNFSKSKIKFVSALYGEQIDEEKVLDADYWTSHIREKVDFYKAVSSINTNENYVYLEVGSTRVLSALCTLILGESKIVLGTLNLKKEDAIQVAETIAMLYIAGVNINWDNVEFFGKTSWNKVSLPNYPYDKSVFWKELHYDRKTPESIPIIGVNKLLGQKIQSPLMENSVVFQRKFKADEPYFMKEHIIFDTPISPAAAHISMLLSAVKEFKNPASCVIKSVELRVPLAVNKGEERLVQICLQEVEDRKMKFKVVSRDEQVSDSNWLLHAQGEVITSDEFFYSDVNVNIEEFKAKKEDSVIPENGIYKMMKSSGFNLGISFRRIMTTSCIGGESISLIKPDENVPNLDMYELYPGVIDSVLQTQICALLDEIKEKNDRSDEKSKKTSIPYYLGSIKYNYRESNDLWVHGNTELRDGIIYSNSEAYNLKGEAIIKMDDIMTQLTDRGSLLREIKNNSNSLYYHTDWMKIEKNDFKASNIKNYLIIGDERNITEIISSKLSQKNINVISALYERDEYIKENSNLYYIDVTKKDYIDKLINDVINENRIEELKIIYCCGINVNCNNEEELKLTNSLSGLLNLVKVINKIDIKDNIKIKILTQNVQKPDSYHKINLNQAALWGFAKVMSIEHLKLFDGILDIDTESVDSNTFIEELISNSLEEVCLCEGRRYISRLIKHAQYSHKQEKLKPILVIENASYLITGGTGTLGRVYAKQLIKKGAKNLILMCRHKPSIEVMEQINEFRENGVNIEILYADVCDKDSLDKGITIVTKKLPPIKGVIHAAGVLRDKMIVDQEWEDFEKVLAPKVIGTVNVYNTLNKEDLDFFIMLSSMTSIIGNMGQSNYASANYFMNKIAKQMQKDGIIAYAMCWGPWQFGGMASQNKSIDENMSAMGIKAFSIETGENIIEQYFEKPYEETVILDINWERMNSNLPRGWQRKFLSEIISEYPQNKVQKSNVNNSILEKLKGMDSDEKKEFLLNKFQQKCGKIMGFTNGKLPASDIGLREQGADSLMIFSMRNELNKLLDINLDVAAFFNYPTLIELTNYLIDEFILVKAEEEEDFIEESADDILQELTKLTE